MEIKKAAHVDLERGKGYNLLLGLVVALSVLFTALQWRSYASNEKVERAANAFEREETMLIEDMQEEQPKEEPPVQQAAPEEVLQELPQEFEVVKNDKEVTTRFASVEENKVTAPPAPVVTVVEEEADEVFNVVEENAEFPNGDVQAYLGKKIVYPEIAIDNGIQGRVTLQFVVEKDGSITDIKVVRGVDSSLDKEAVRVVKEMPKWKPGKQRGKPVRSRFTLPVMFRLQQ